VQDITQANPVIQTHVDTFLQFSQFGSPETGMFAIVFGGVCNSGESSSAFLGRVINGFSNEFILKY
jgi:hypothetical protein